MYFGHFKSSDKILITLVFLRYFGHEIDFSFGYSVEVPCTPSNEIEPHHIILNNRKEFATHK